MICRYLDSLCSAHYHASPLNFSADLMGYEEQLLRILTGVDNIKSAIQKAIRRRLVMPRLSNLEIAKVLKDKFVAAMDDDFNTADAISAIFELSKEAVKRH